MLLNTLACGDEIRRYQNSIVILFKDERKVLSTSHLNGGYRENLKSVFNHDIHAGLGMKCEITPDIYERHMQLVAAELGLDPAASAGLLTAASMDNAASRTAGYEDISVTAIVTGGIEENGGRVGDPAVFHERRGQTIPVREGTVPPREGTINILLHLDANLPAETMARALVTCTEAKTAALQELLAESKYSRGLATGSGTDGTIIISNSKSGSKLIYAGKHSKLGELIGLTVKEAIKEALSLQTGLCPESQFSMLNRLRRFGLNADKFREVSGEKAGLAALDRMEFKKRLEILDQEEDVVVLASLYAHLLDQLAWRLLSPAQAASGGRILIRRLLDKYGLEDQALFSPGSGKDTITVMTDIFAAAIGGIIESSPLFPGGSGTGKAEHICSEDN